MVLAPTLSLNTPARGYDADATAFAAASGATDVSNLSAFVKGVKELGLWSNMVCWPLRSSQNAGTGTTAYSLGGLTGSNGSFENSPTWTPSGVEFSDESDDYIATGYTPPKEDHLLFAVMEANPQGTNNNAIASARRAGALTGGYTYAQNWTGVWRSILWTSGGFIDNTGDAAITDGSFHSATFRTALITSPQQADISIDGGSYDTVSGSITPDDPEELVLGNEANSATRALGGALAFAAYVSVPYSTAATYEQSLHNLYKSTLGTGLGLP
jgi:hypothetical protein